MVRRIRLWKALLFAALGGLTGALLSAFQSARTSRPQGVSPPPHSSAGGAGPHGRMGASLFDPHWLPNPLPGDSDWARILDAEEVAFGILDPHDPDQDSNQELDGLELARLLGEVIDVLPWWAPPDPAPEEIVKIDYSQWGMELCDVCGEQVNMGFIRVYNPWKDLGVDLHFIGMHYLRHGSFVFDGSLHEGRIDAARLHDVLDDLHRLRVTPDADGDLLENGEEVAIGTDPLEPDENGNFVEDGRDLAATMLAQLELLPSGPLPDRVYKVDNMAFGLENCEICGGVYNMGFLEITDPVKQLSAMVYYVALHHMEHGSFAFDGTVHDGRVDVPRLHEILKDA